MKRFARHRLQGTRIARRGAALAFSLLLVFAAAPALAQSAGDPVDDELLVKYETGQAPNTLTSTLQAAGATDVRGFLPEGSALSSHPLAQWRHVILAPGTDDDAAMDMIAADPSVERVIRNVWGESLAVPNDPRFSDQWSLDNTGQTGGTVDADVDAPEAWDSQTMAASTVIAIIDMGINYNHPDLAPNMWTNPGEIPGNGVDDDGNGFVDDVFGADTANDDGDPFDNRLHGTHVAGIAAAVGNNGVGVTGVAWNAQIMAVRHHDGGAKCADAIEAVMYATLEGADVINASWRMPNCPALKDAIALAGSQGIPFVAAAGNAGQDNDEVPTEPATFDLLNIIAVAATNDDDQLASISNVGNESVEVAAPGADVLSTVGSSSYIRLPAGTSFAAPHVTGTVALVLARHPDIAMDELKTALVLGSDPIQSLNGLVLLGRRLNVAGVLAASDQWAGHPDDLWVCDDGIDNDGDGLTDYPDDPGCNLVFPATTEAVACDDGVDNDNDGKIDFDGKMGTQPDPQCSSASDNTEREEMCGIGFELALLLPALMGLRGLRRRRVS